MIIICQSCFAEHNGTYGSGRFCNAKCARSFSTKAKRKEINNTVSQKLTGRKTHDKGFKVGFDPRRRSFTEEDWIKAVKALQLKRNERNNTLPFERLSRKVRYARLFEMQNGRCAECGISNSWNNKPLVFHYDHINGDRYNNQLENSRLLCPNCHSQTLTYCGKNIIEKGKLVSDAELVQAIERGGSIHQGLILMGLAPKGANYKRCRRLLNKF